MDKNKVAKIFAKAVAQQSPAEIVYNPQADFDWIASSGLAWLQLDISVPYEIIYKEITAIESYFVNHRHDYGNNLGWQSFCVHGKSYDATREDEYYDDNRSSIWTKEALELMPLTVDYFKNTWPCEQYNRLRIMKLSPGAVIEIHQDNPGPSRMGPINIAINQPIGCNFYIENHGIVPFVTGSAFWLDVGNRHCVINDSDENRYHIIIHQNFATKGFEDLVIRSYNKQYGSR